MKRCVYEITTDAAIAKETLAEAQALGLHPETYLRTENVERLHLSVYIIVADVEAAATHGKGGVPELPAVE